MKRKIRENRNNGQQEIRTEGEVTSAGRRQKGWKPRDESKGDSALSSGSGPRRAVELCLVCREARGVSCFS